MRLCLATTSVRRCAPTPSLIAMSTAYTFASYSPQQAYSTHLCTIKHQVTDTTIIQLPSYLCGMHAIYRGWHAPLTTLP